MINIDKFLNKNYVIIKWLIFNYLKKIKEKLLVKLLNYLKKFHNKKILKLIKNVIVIVLTLFKDFFYSII